MFDLARLIHPVDPATFEREYWEQKPLVVARNDPRYYHDLLSLADVDRILAVSSIRSPGISIVHAGDDIPLSRLGDGGLFATFSMLEALYAEYRSGSTIVLEVLDERWKPLMRLCQSLAAEFSAGMQVNAYLTPPSSSALDTHFDTHDVFVLQTHGSKHWRLFGSPIRLPRKGQRETGDPGDPLQEFDLYPGDMIYIPRGYLHDAVTRGSSSLHLTVGILPMLWADVLRDAVDSIIARDSRFRESLPFGFARSEAKSKEAEVRAGELLAILREETDSASLIADATAEALRAQPPFLDGHLLDLEMEPRIELETEVRRRTEIIPHLTLEGENVCLQFHGKKVLMPSDVQPALRFITAASQFTAAQLTGELDDEGKLNLVRRLVREGFLTTR
jgi:ribosomal protein L16 Arg81 hydroxylase